MSKLVNFGGVAGWLTAESGVHKSTPQSFFSMTLRGPCRTIRTLRCKLHQLRCKLLLCRLVFSHNFSNTVKRLSKGILMPGSLPRPKTQNIISSDCRCAHKSLAIASGASQPAGGKCGTCTKLWARFGAPPVFRTLSSICFSCLCSRDCTAQLSSKNMRQREIDRERMASLLDTVNPPDHTSQELWF